MNLVICIVKIKVKVSVKQNSVLRSSGAKSDFCDLSLIQNLILLLLSNNKMENLREGIGLGSITHFLGADPFQQRNGLIGISL